MMVFLSYFMIIPNTILYQTVAVEASWDWIQIFLSFESKVCSKIVQLDLLRLSVVFLFFYLWLSKSVTFYDRPQEATRPDLSILFHFTLSLVRSGPATRMYLCLEHSVLYKQYWYQKQGTYPPSSQRLYITIKIWFQTFTRHSMLKTILSNTTLCLSFIV